MLRTAFTLLVLVALGLSGCGRKGALGAAAGPDFAKGSGRQACGQGPGEAAVGPLRSTGSSTEGMLKAFSRTLPVTEGRGPR